MQHLCGRRACHAEGLLQLRVHVAEGTRRIVTRRTVWIASTVVCGALVLWAARAGRMLVVDAPQKSDVILVLAGETDRRPARALELLDQGWARVVIIDVPQNSTIYDVTQIKLAESYINKLPQAAAVRICSIEGLSTRDEARDAEKCLAREQASRILIVTSDFHTRRALSIFRHEMRGRSFSIAAAYDDAQFGTRWWTHRQWAKVMLEEWIRLLWWSVIDRWR